MRRGVFQGLLYACLMAAKQAHGQVHARGKNALYQPLQDQVAVVRDNLLAQSGDATLQQFDDVCEILMEELLFLEVSCTCSINTFQNNAELDCRNFCLISSMERDYCVDFGFQMRFSLIPLLEFQSLSEIFVQSGADSSQSTLKLTYDFDESGDFEEECFVSINGQLCTSCAVEENDFDCTQPVDCRNLGLPSIVDVCDYSQVSQLPSSNPLSYHKLDFEEHDEEFDLSECTQDGTFSPSPSLSPPPVGPPVKPRDAAIPAPTTTRSSCTANTEMPSSVLPPTIIGFIERVC